MDLYISILILVLFLVAVLGGLVSLVLYIAEKKMNKKSYKNPEIIDIKKEENKSDPAN